MRDPNNPCLFCNPKESGIAHENDLAYASYDTYPVSEQHCLIIPKRHVVDYFELSNEELIACNDLIKKIKLLVKKQHHDLIEDLAENIFEIIFQNSLVKKTNIKIEKLDIIKNSESVGVEFSKSKI